MPQKVPFPIVLPYNKTKQIGINPERTINMYAINVGDENSTSALIGTPGLDAQISFAEGAKVRNLFTFEDNMYAVVSEYVYIIDVLLSPVLIGKVGTTSGQVGIAANNANQIIFVDGTGGWIYNSDTNVYEQITSEGFPNPAPNSVAFFNGFFIVNSIGTNLWAVSSLNDGLTWDPTRVQTFQSQPDIIQAIAVLKTAVFIIAKNNIEIWVGIPQLGFPLSRDSTIRFQIGTSGVGSVVQSEDMLFWLSQSTNGRSSIMMSSGSFPQEISTNDIDQEINSYPTVADAFAYMYRLNGHLFYAISFPTANKNWLYDVTTKYWVQQQMQDQSIYIVSDAATFGGNVYAGDLSEPIVYLMNQDLLTNNGESITRQRVTNPFYSPTVQAIRLNSLEVDVVQGQGTLNPPGNYPYLYCETSYDRGITWGKVRRSRISRMGKTVGYRCVFRNMGVNKDFTFRLTTYDPINLTIRADAINYDIVGN